MTDREQRPDSDSLRDIALFLEGVKHGRGGNIQPLGNYSLKQLWLAVKYFRHDIPSNDKDDEIDNEVCNSYTQSTKCAVCGHEKHAHRN